MKRLQRQSTLILILIGLITNNLQAIAVGELVAREPRRLKVKKGWVPGVRVLDLSGLDITSLEGLEGIPGIEKVTRLYVDNNRIRTIESGDLAAAPNLSALSISGNGLKDIKPNAFAGLKKLKVLNLSDNRIDSIPQGGLNGMSSLRFLGMSNNPMPNPKGTLQSQVPKAFITTLPITTANIRKWSAIVGAGVATLIAAIAAVTVAAKKAGSKKEKSIAPPSRTGGAPRQEPSGTSESGKAPGGPEKRAREEESKAFYHHVVSELGLEEYVPLGENIPVHEDFEQSLAMIGTMDYVLPTLTQLRIMGLSKEQVVELIRDWRNKGHRFPDERFDNYSVAHALARYASNFYGTPIGMMRFYEPTHQIGGKKYPQ